MNIGLVKSCLLSATLLIAPIAVNADMVSTAHLLAQDERTASLQRLDAFLARDEVSSQLVAMGVSSAQAAERVANLTDAQLQQMAQGIEDMPAGADPLGTVVTVLVIILLLEILGITDISDRI